MKYLILTSFVVLSALSAVSQNKSDKKPTFSELKAHQLTKIDSNPEFIIIIDSLTFNLETLIDYNIKEEWIESTTVLKDNMTKKIYGNENGAIIIRIKKKYHKEAIKELDA